MNYALTLLKTNMANPTPTVATFNFPPEVLAFQGHFPNAPLLPGFMHVQLALDILQASGKPYHLISVPAAKFLNPLLPNQTATATLSQNATNTYEVTITHEERTLSTFSIIVQ
jgi:3-hydroxymyristoyl/3-hydroxydecanoyl-(acyl carrier protein) dehydratase